MSRTVGKWAVLPNGTVSRADSARPPLQPGRRTPTPQTGEAGKPEGSGKAREAEETRETGETGKAEKREKTEKTEKTEKRGRAKDTVELGEAADAGSTGAPRSTGELVSP
ncbi:hypothetical protein K2224_05115 [Streptomyces sp. BHT-5-2]|uniref:hypothetical protein n=1 Tax=unclassified Streptomyces TaxID=2593676 RepID=UPI001C8EBBD3|nr:hypothetical protein [Streptomyces sp. BHT-5-2]QZL02680.1 hypothetical protein K2224_05115 [Streptomyces sp. BHT-5-2]